MMWKKVILVLSLLFLFVGANPSTALNEKYETVSETAFPLNSTAGEAYLYLNEYSCYGKELFGFLVKETNRMTTPWVEKAEYLLKVSYGVEQVSSTGKDFVKNLSKKLKKSENYPMYVQTILLRQFTKYSADA